MKCRSVACVWSGTLPSHPVTAVAAASDPPAVYTGGSDGSIIWWSLSVADSEPEFRPRAMLCGHAAPIPDLDICDPVVASGSERECSSSSDASRGLFSVSTDGVMCVWSRSSGHCRRRRKLPPWAGSPSTVRTLGSNPRYVCVACCVIDNARLTDHSSVDSVELGDGSTEREARDRKGQKCSVVIVDTYSLTVAQTVMRGNLSIGSLRFMAVVSPTEEEKCLVVLSDALGRLQKLSISEDLHEQKESVSGLLESSSQLDPAVSEEGIIEGLALSMAISGNFVAFVLESRCIFRLLDNGTTIGEIPFVDSFICRNSDSFQLDGVGCMFLKRDEAKDMLSTEDVPDIHERKFAVWNDRGQLILFLITYSKGVLTFEPLSEIPVDAHLQDQRPATSFIQLDRYILRVQSLCIDDDKPFHWKPFVTIYEEGVGLRMHGKGSSFIDWTRYSNSVHESKRTSEPETLYRDISGASTSSNSRSSKRVAVSSSMVISETSFAPYGIVYGFVNGEIEVIRFDFLEGHNADSPLSRQIFVGHTASVLCLAAHHLVNVAKDSNISEVLVSGSKDCTIRIWDLETGNIITVLHQHVGPVHQIILPPVHTAHPWSDCFLSVGEDFSVTLSSFETMRVERIFPGHLNYPAKVVWDGERGYIACLCPHDADSSDAKDILYLWDVKTGSKERVIRGSASHSMFDHFCQGVSDNSSSNNANTSLSSLILPIIEDGSSSGSHVNNMDIGEKTGQSHQYAIKCSCPFPGIAALSFDLVSLMFTNDKHENTMVKDQRTKTSNPQNKIPKHDSDVNGTSTDALNELDSIRLLEERLIRFSLSFLHLWGADPELDYLLLTDMKLKRPDKFFVASGLQGDKGSLTLAFPDISALLELWKSSSEFCAMRSLTMVSLAQRMISLSHTTSSASSALAAFYTRNFAEKFHDIKPPLLQLLVSFWQEESDHIRMAARTLFHCAASRAIPPPLCAKKSSNRLEENSKSDHKENGNGNLIQEEDLSALTSSPNQLKDTNGISQAEKSTILAWLESFEMQDWTSCIGGTSQDAMTSHIIVAASLAIWYPSLVKPCLASLVVHPLTKLVMAMNEKYSSTAAELLAEGMESTWKDCIAPEIPRLIGDIFFQIECVSGSSVNSAAKKSVIPNSICETLVGVLLPSLGMADVLAFLTVVESQVWSTASDSPVHPVSLVTLTRIVRGSPKSVAQYLDKVVSFILQTMEPSNSVMRRACLQSSITALKEVVHGFPMVAINENWTRLAIGDAVGEIKSATIRVYDMQSVVKIKVLDASAPPGLPSLLGLSSETVVSTAISALSFSPDGEGLVAFSEHGLMIRWWSLGSVWWEKLTRNLTPIQCTKLIFVPPWEGFSPNSSRSSIMGSVMGDDRHFNFQDNPKVSSHVDNLKVLIHNLDLSYRLQWVEDRKVALSRHGHELGTYQL